MTTVGVVGTGRMGSAMARSLARGGSELILQNRTMERCAPLASELGCRVVATPAEAAAAADIVISMLANQEAVEAAWSGSDGLLSGARPGTVLVDMSTVPPSVIQSFATQAAEAGAGILDAPVSGSVPLAETGKLTIMVGGSEADLEKARPAFEQLATSIHHIGPLGTAAALKLAVNTLIFGLNQSVSEALVLAERAGISRDVAYDVFAAGAAGAPYVQYKRAAFVDPEGTPVAFSLDLAAKDLRLILDLAASLGVEMPQTLVNQSLVQAATEEFGPDRDTSIVAAHLRAKARTLTPAGSRKGSNS
ncbi:MAG TPA: NAD(P)-dependent oxidoreductase [Candidatus Limnocylindria bacterium]|nr:NAD(P)-dependent oxidoreductase [Candidatus Limnocylindria bacterium]